MANPLMSVLGVSSQTNSKSIAEQFKDFRNSFKGDPQAKINEMLSNGQITQSQLNQATEMAKMVQVMLKK